jgi:ferredoxin
MERQIIRIDEDKCDGCGVCTEGCPEGALQLIEGKARLVSDLTCDGLGACIPACPQGAITLETREAAPYDERLVIDNILPLGAATLGAHLKHLHHHGQTTFLDQALAYLRELGAPVPPYKETPMHQGCPGSAPRAFPAAPALPDPGGVPAVQPSQLTQWPIQLHLVSPMNPAFHKADLLLAADCTVAALPDFHRDWLAGRKLALACPKLDPNQEVYVDKLTLLIDEARIDTLTVLIMEVPCCGGLLRLAQKAAARATRVVPVKAVVVGIDGRILREDWMAPA